MVYCNIGTLINQIDTTTLHQGVRNFSLPAANFRKTLELEDLQLGNKRVTSNAGHGKLSCEA